MDSLCLIWLAGDADGAVLEAATRLIRTYGVDAVRVALSIRSGLRPSIFGAKFTGGEIGIARIKLDGDKAVWLVVEFRPIHDEDRFDVGIFVDVRYYYSSVFGDTSVTVAHVVGWENMRPEDLEEAPGYVAEV